MFLGVNRITKHLHFLRQSVCSCSAKMSWATTCTYCISLGNHIYSTIRGSTVEPQLFAPRLSGFLDYLDFFSGPNFVMNIY